MFGYEEPLQYLVIPRKQVSNRMVTSTKEPTKEISRKDLPKCLILKL